MTVIDLSVVICVYTESRWTVLLSVIESVKRQTTPPLEIIIVVDHNPHLKKRIRNNIIDVTVLDNQEQKGLSGARNTGIKAAQGSVIAFIDDDAIAELNWLEELSVGYTNPEVKGVGGEVVPHWKTGKPQWYPEEFYWVVGCTYLGMPVKTEYIRNFLGCNMSFRRELFDKIGGFKNGIGRVDSIPMGCEETELCIRTQKILPNSLFLYRPSARVVHHVPEDRARLSYFLSRCYSEGLSKAQITKLVGTRNGLSSEKVYTTKTLPQGALRGVKYSIFNRDLDGLKRAGTILVGLLTTIFGYLIGTVRRTPIIVE